MSPTTYTVASMIPRGHCGCSVDEVNAQRPQLTFMTLCLSFSDGDGLSKTGIPG